MTGVKVDEARRVDGRDDLRGIHIEPYSDRPVAVRLPATTDCNATGATCTDDGRPLSNSSSTTFAGPVGISVADAEVVEATGAVLGFGVTLSRAASQSLTIDYATSDGTASAGSDYTATSGTLTNSAGTSSGAIKVPVLDDSHDDVGETLTLTLSDPTSGTIADRSATGTITNDDALPAARLGRAAALHIVVEVEERLNAPRSPGFDGRFAGRQINRDIAGTSPCCLQQMSDGRNARRDGHRVATGAFGNRGLGAGSGPQTAGGNAYGMPAMQGLHPQEAYQGGIGPALGRSSLTEGSKLPAQPRAIGRRHPVVLEPERQLAVSRDETVCSP